MKKGEFFKQDNVISCDKTIKMCQPLTRVVTLLAAILSVDSYFASFVYLAISHKEIFDFFIVFVS